VEREFLCVVNQTTFRQLRNGRFPPNLVTKRISCPVAESGKSFSKIITFGVIFPQNLKLKIGQTGISLRAIYSNHACSASEQATGHGIHCMQLFTPCCSPRAREFPRSSQLFSTTYRPTVAELWGVKVAQFSDFGLFSPYKTPKTYLPVTRLQPRSYIAE